MLDLQLLRILKYRQDFYRIKGRIPENTMDAQTRYLLKLFGEYFEAMPDDDRINLATFLPIFRSKATHIKPDDLPAYEKVLASVQSDVPPDQKDGVMNALLELRLSTEMLQILEKFEEGDIANVHAHMNEVMMNFAKDAELKTVDYIRDDIYDLLAEEANEDVGVSFRLECLRQACRFLKGGDFGIIAGRPDRGKTTFVASEITYMASQLPNDRPVVWLNNEGPGKRIIPRLYQAALGMTLSEMKGVKDLKQAYIDAVGMIDKIRVVDIHGMDTYAVENIIRQNKPGIVIYDMIDHIRGFGGEARTDLVLEEMYKWGREIAVKYDLVGLATSQISNDGDGMQFPSLGMLKDSKTGKQGACDFQIMIGATNDPGQAGLRFIGMPKNKIRREGAVSDPRATVNFKPQIARFEDVPIDSGALEDQS